MNYTGAVHDAVLKINVKKLLKLEKTIDFLYTQVYNTICKLALDIIEC